MFQDVLSTIAILIGSGGSDYENFRILDFDKQSIYQVILKNLWFRSFKDILKVSLPENLI